jgi:hypothetical protein
MLCQTRQPRFLCLIELRLCRLPNLEHMRGILVLPSLKTLHLFNMPKLKVLWTTTSGLGIGEEEVSGQYCFPVLSHLTIVCCPKLIMKPNFPPSLEVLKLEGCNNQILSLGSHVAEPLSSSRAFDVVPLLKELKLKGMTGPTLDWGFLQHLARLEVLIIEKCNGLTEIPESTRGLTSLQKQQIEDCPALNALPEAIQHLTSLAVLRIRRCPALTALPEGIGQLSALRRLDIQNCSALGFLPRSIGRLTALQTLFIWGCTAELARRYEKGVGDDRHLLSHIPRVMIE